MDEGGLPPGTDVEALAAFFHRITQAISFQTGDGATRDALSALIDPALAALAAA